MDDVDLIVPANKISLCSSLSVCLNMSGTVKQNTQLRFPTALLKALDGTEAALRCHVHPNISQHKNQRLFKPIRSQQLPCCRAEGQKAGAIKKRGRDRVQVHLSPADSTCRLCSLQGGEERKHHPDSR